MRNPTPAALLVDHPYVRDPKVEGVVSGCDRRKPTVPVSSLSRRDRYRAAVQLTAAAALFADFDLWLPGSALRSTRFTRTELGLRADTTEFPISLSTALDHLGGGEAAVETARETVLRRIAAAVGLEPEAMDAGRKEPGFFLEGAVVRQLRELPRPLDICTARALWAFRWAPLPEPENGTVDYWLVESRSLARRMAGALYCDLRLRNREAWVWPADGVALDTAAVPGSDRSGVMILVGDLTHTELAALARWAQREGCGAVAVGTFPSGWRPPCPPAFRGEHLARHLAVVGPSLDQARKFVDGRRGTFNPFSGIDRKFVTACARTVFAEPNLRPSSATAAPQNDVAGWLELSPQGLPAGFVAAQTGLTPSELESQRDAAHVVERGGHWRLPHSIQLSPDPRHVDIAGLFEGEDPLHLLHSALGVNDPEHLLAWARQLTEELDDALVRTVLSQIEPGALGPQLQLVLAEACLSMRDLAAAKAALAVVEDDSGDSLKLWLEALDRIPGNPRELPAGLQGPETVRAVAETAILTLREIRRNYLPGSKKALKLIRQALLQLRGACRRRIEIELASIEEPSLLAERRWRREQVGDHPRLMMQLMCRRGLHLLSGGAPRNARRMLERAAIHALGPGEVGSIELNLGSVALGEGRSPDADRHNLQAYKLLRSAGFVNRTQLVLFNLAVADVDQLRVEKARERFSILAAESTRDPFVLGELARLSLACGEEQEFSERLGSFAASIDAEDSRFVQGLHLLQGAEALLAGRLTAAIEHFREADQEAGAWLDLAAAVEGQGTHRHQPDSWGISTAASIVREIKNGSGTLDTVIGKSPWKVSDAVGAAVAEKVAGVRLPLETEVRLRLARTLRRARLNGWADQLVDKNSRGEAAMSALAQVLERGDFRDLDEPATRQLLVGLGLEGLEIGDRDGRATIWEAGKGEPGSERRCNGVTIVPLGGEVDDSPVWRLFLAILGGLVVPAMRWSDDETDETGFLGVSDAARRVRRELCEIAPSHLSVLIHGETGVGKEVAARALHRLSGRKGQFVAVNIAAIPPGLLEAELFGSVKGAFTGADRSRQGLVSTADGGTLLIDEVGDLDPLLQVKLLRFLESNEIRAVGSNELRSVDVRVLSATHRDLEKRMRDGRFRSDLYYRLAAPTLPIPPLRERRRDIMVLKEAFEREACVRRGLERCRWSEEANAAVEEHSWPGNARELRWVVEVAMVRAAGSIVRLDHLPISAAKRVPSGTWAEAQREFRRQFLIESLRRNGGNRSATARELGISRQALLYHLRNLGLSKSTLT